VVNQPPTPDAQLPTSNLSVLLTPIVVKDTISLADLSGKRLVGTDFHPGIKGIGPKQALVTRYGAIERMPSTIHDAFGPELDRLRQIITESITTACPA
jgi:hypothetical protein